MKSSAIKKKHHENTEPQKEYLNEKRILEKQKPSL